MNKILRIKLLIILACWCVLSLLLYLILIVQTTGFDAFFYDEKNQDITLVERPIIEPIPEIAEEVIIEPTEETKPTENIMQVGTKNGKATLGSIETKFQEDTCIITIPYTGTTGEYTSFSPSNINSFVIDLHGDFTYQDKNIKFNDKPYIKIIQSAKHKGYVRVSLILKPKVHITHTQITYTDNIITITCTFEK